MEKHPFGYYLPEKSEKLIIGSFPCFNGENYGDWFYSGSGRSDFWQLLSDLFDCPVNSRKDKEELRKINGIAITDIASKIRRKKGNCSDANLEVIEFNKEAIDLCLDRGIKELFFTSKFVEKHFLKCFPEIQLPSFVLLSPSPAANIFIAGLGEYKNLKETGSLSTPYEYRLLKYRQAFNLNDN